jgi:hypothetical protein
MDLARHAADIRRELQLKAPQERIRVHCFSQEEAERLGALLTDEERARVTFEWPGSERGPGRLR